MQSWKNEKNVGEIYSTIDLLGIGGVVSLQMGM